MRNIVSAFILLAAIPASIEAATTDTSVEGIRGLRLMARTAQIFAHSPGVAGMNPGLQYNYYRNWQGAYIERTLDGSEVLRISSSGRIDPFKQWESDWSRVMPLSIERILSTGVPALEPGGILRLETEVSDDRNSQDIQGETYGRSKLQLSGKLESGSGVGLTYRGTGQLFEYYHDVVTGYSRKEWSKTCHETTGGVYETFGWSTLSQGVPNGANYDWELGIGDLKPYLIESPGPLLGPNAYNQPSNATDIIDADDHQAYKVRIDDVVVREFNLELSDPVIFSDFLELVKINLPKLPDEEGRTFSLVSYEGGSYTQNWGEVDFQEPELAWLISTETDIYRGIGSEHGGYADVQHAEYWWEFDDPSLRRTVTWAEIFTDSVTGQEELLGLKAWDPSRDPLCPRFLLNPYFGSHAGREGYYRVEPIQCDLIALDQQGNISQEPFLPTLTNSSPRVKVTSVDVSNVRLSADQGILADITVSGTVESDVCDRFPGEDGTISSGALYVNRANESFADFPILPTKGIGNALGKKYPYLGTIQTTILAVRVVPGMNILSFRAADPIVKLEGYHDWSVNIAPVPILPEGVEAVFVETELQIAIGPDGLDPEAELSKTIGVG